MVEKRKYDEYGRPIKKKSFFNKFSLNSKEDSQDQFDQYKPTKFKQIEKKNKEKQHKYEENFNANTIDDSTKENQFLTSPNLYFLYPFSILFSNFTLIITAVLFFSYRNKQLSLKEKRGFTIIKRCLYISIFLTVLGVIFLMFITHVIENLHAYL
mgnify:CR=1 FL=1